MATEPSRIVPLAQGRRRADEATRLTAELAELRLTGRDAAQLVTITVDGAGRAVRADISDWAWKRCQPAVLGRHVVVALSQARAAALRAAAPIVNSFSSRLRLGPGEEMPASLDTGLVTTADNGRALVGSGSDSNGVIRTRVTRNGVRAITMDHGRASRLTAEELAQALAEAESRATIALGRKIAERSGLLPAHERNADD